VHDHELYIKAKAKPQYASDAPWLTV